MLTYHARKELKRESWRNHISDLIQKYGKDNCKDDHWCNKDVNTRIKYHHETMYGCRTKNRYQTCISGPRRSVLDRIS